MAGPVIKLRCASWGQLATIYERDLKRGTLFVRTTAKLPLGKEARVDIVMPTGSVVTVDGRVAHLMDGGERGAGFELVLAKLPPSSMWLIESALNRAKTESQGIGDDTVQEDVSAARAEEELLAALEGELYSLRGMNPHQVLGVGYQASESEARGAFAELSKKYHPDRFARFESPRARQVAADIFVVLREAYRQIAEAAGRHVAGPRRATPAGGVPILDPAVPIAVEERTGSVPVRRPGTPAQGVPVTFTNRPGTPAQGVPVTFTSRPGTPAQGVPITVQPPALPPPPPSGPPRQGPPPAEPAGPPRAVVSFKATTAAPAVPPPPSPSISPPSISPPPISPAALAGVGRSSRLDADFLFGDIDGSPAPAAPPPIMLEDPLLAEADALLASGKLTEALAIYEQTIRDQPTHRAARAGRELAFGLKKSAAGEREAALRHFEAALEIEPWSDRAARELANIRRAATERGKGLLSKLLGKGEAKE